MFTAGSREEYCSSVRSQARVGCFRKWLRARPRRLYTLASLVNNRSAISLIPKPQRLFRANTSCDSTGIASSQQTNSIRNRSSRISPTRKISGPYSGVPRSSFAFCSRMRLRAVRWRNSPMRWLCATRKSQADGLSGRPAIVQVSSALIKAD